MEAMSAPSPWSNPAALLADHDWARRLAQRLVRDAALAEDLAQEACVRSLERPPLDSVRAWLGGVVRNLARQARRESSRRARREALAARAEALPAADEALERLAVQQDVVRAVLALAEPYRSTIVLRFYEGLPPRRIAAREGIPLATVKTRLARGLAQLRDGLDREHGGDGRSWALALLPLTTPGRGLGPLVIGAALMNTLVKVGLTAAAVVALVVWLERRKPHAIEPPATGEPTSEVGAELVAPAALEHTAEPVARESIALVSPPAAPAPALAAGDTITGRVIDVEGSPVPGVDLDLRASNGSRMDPEEAHMLVVGSSAFGSLLWTEPLRESGAPLAVSGADGRFSLLTPPEYFGHIVSRDPLWESVLTPSARVRAGEDQVLVVAPRIRLAGTVHDVHGTPLAGVELRFGVPRERLHAPGANLEDTLAPDWSTTSNERGWFELARAPAVPGAKLRASLEPYPSKVIEREAWTDDELEIVLERAPGAWLEGVVEADGQPIAAAVVALGTHATKTDAHGSFQIHLEGRAQEAELCAAAAGFLPKRVRGDPNEDGSVRWPSFVRIELDGAPLALSGTVVDAEGAPLAGQEIWLGEGRAVLNDRFPFLLESVLAGKPDLRLGTKSDGNGGFELGGLEGREYMLRIVDPQTALVSDAGPFAAGRADLRLVQPTDQIWPIVRGSVVSGAGTPIVGLGVLVIREVDMVGLPSTTYFAFQAVGARAETDANGAFELHDVPKNGVRLMASSMEVVDPEFELTVDMDPLHVRVVVDLWVQLEVRVGASYPGAKGFAVLDAAGQALGMEVPMSGGVSRLSYQALSAGSSPVVKVNDRAAVVVLFGEAGELDRQAVALRTGVINRVEF